MNPLLPLGGSTLALASIVYYAWSMSHEFYTAAIFLSTNKLAKLTLGCLGLSLCIALGAAIRKLFLGPLRQAEVETLYENCRFAVMETCLALTIFREEINANILGLFMFLFLFKSLHWLIRLRVEHVEQSGLFSRVSHLRLIGLHLFLLIVDEPSVIILFAFEFAILGLLVCTNFLRYLIHLVDMQMDGGWRTKHTFVFFVEFATDIMSFFFYFVFFSVVFLYYGIPIYIMRDLWVAYTNIRRRIRTYIRYRKLTSNMDEKIPNATEEELEECEHTCVICRDHMDVGKRLPCGHIYHISCLQMWLQQQQTCPTCRVDIASSFQNRRSTRPSPRPGVQADVPSTGGTGGMNDSGSPYSQAGDVDSASFTPQKTQTKALRVVCDEARIYNVPSCAEGTLIVRRIPKGTFLLILGETRTPRGEHFFRVIDGWIPDVEQGLVIVERLSHPEQMRYTPSSLLSSYHCSPVRQISFTPAASHTDSEHKQCERTSSSSTPNDRILSQQLALEGQLADLKRQMNELKQQQQEEKLSGGLLRELPEQPQKDGTADERKNHAATVPKSGI